MPLPQNLLDLLEKADASRATAENDAAVLADDQAALTQATAVRDEQAGTVAASREQAAADAQAAIKALDDYFGISQQSPSASRRR